MGKNTKLVIKHHNKNLYNEDYISFNKKYNDFLNECFLKQIERPRRKKVIFLSGDPGSGKTVTLKHEFVKKFKNLGIEFLEFTFLPDADVYNYFFIESLSQQLIFLLNNYMKKNISKKFEMMRDIRTLKTINKIYDKQKQSPFDCYEKYKKFNSILNFYSQDLKIFLVIEDIHFSNKNLNDYLSLLNKNIDEQNFYALFSTRKKENEHNEIFKEYRKWFNIPKLPVENVKKYISLFKEKNIEISFDRDEIISLSDSNPFYIQEIFLLNIEKNKFKNKKTLIDFQSFKDGRESIIKMRYSFLSEEEKYLLSTIHSLGFSVEKNLLFEICKFLKIDCCKEDLVNLENKKFVKSDHEKITFYHGLIYETLKNTISNDALIAIRKKLYSFYRTKNEIKFYEKIVDICLKINHYSQAFYYAKKLAKYFFDLSEHRIAQNYYEIALNIIESHSSAKRVLQRTIDIITEYHMSCLLSGNSERAKSLANYLLSINNEISNEEKYKINTALCTSYWTIGELSEAKKYIKKNIEISKLVNNRDYIFASNSRYGTLSYELGFFNDSLKSYNLIFDQIDITEKLSSFGMLIQAYYGVKSINSICNFELGNLKKSHDDLIESYEHFKESDHVFTKLFIALHSGYSSFMMGEHELALKYIEKSLKLQAKSQITLLVPASLSLCGICHLYQGNKETGIKYIDQAMSLTNQTFKGSKKGIIDYTYAESLLITFNTGSFVETVNIKIQDLEKQGQMSFAGWLYFIKAVYYAFYSNSPVGFIGSYAKATAIADNLGMKSLLWNLKSLSRLEKTGIISNPNEVDEISSPAFDKAMFFYNLTKNINPIFPYRTQK